MFHLLRLSLKIRRERKKKKRSHSDCQKAQNSDFAPSVRQMITLQINDLSRLSAAASSEINGGRRFFSTRKIQLRFSAGKGRNVCQETIAAAETATEKITSDEPQVSVSEEPSSIDFAFVSVSYFQTSV